MQENKKIAELSACEKMICDRKEDYFNRYGLKRILKRSNTGEMRFLVLPLSKLGSIGFLLLYSILSIRNRKYRISVFCDRIIFDDHGTKLIQKKIFSKQDNCLEKNVGFQYLRCALHDFFRLKSILSVYKSYVRARPNTPTSKHALCEFWVYYTIYNFTLARHKYTGVIVVDDFSANRVALILASGEVGLRTGIVKLSDEPKRACPFSSYDVLFCWNYAQSTEENGKYKVVSHLERDVCEIRLLPDVDKTTCSIGIALKSNINDEGLISLLEELFAKEWVREIVVRYHPSTRPAHYVTQNEKITYKVSKGEAENFFESIDLLISGSTSLVKEALLAGVPVAYNAFLDAPGGEDYYAYRSQGIIYDLEGGVFKKDILKKVDLFYNKREWKEVRDQWVSRDPKAVPIIEALKYLGLDLENGVGCSD